MIILSECPPGTYGNNCAHRCECHNSAECDPVSGECICAPGWRGSSCQQSKNLGYWFLQNVILFSYAF